MRDSGLSRAHSSDYLSRLRQPGLPSHRHIIVHTVRHAELAPWVGDSNRLESTVPLMRWPIWALSVSVVSIEIGCLLAHRIGWPRGVAILSLAMGGGRLPLATPRVL